MKNILYLISLLLVSCQTVLTDVAVPKAEVKAVANLSINTINKRPVLELTKSRPVLNNSSSNKYDVITDAIVTLSGDGKQYLFEYDALNKNYTPQQDLELTGGVLYTLNVQNTGLNTLISTANMPYPVGPLDISIDSTLSSYSKDYTVQIVTNDDPAIKQYYRIEAYSMQNGEYESIYVTDEYQDDSKAKDGKNRLKVGFSLWGNGFDDQSLFVIVSTITKDHYTYGKSIVNYNPENPFAEPSPLPSNISGGLGLFSLSNSVKVQLR